MARSPRKYRLNSNHYPRRRALKGELKASARSFLASIAGGLGLIAGIAIAHSLSLPTWAGVTLMFAGFGIGYFGVYWQKARWLIGGGKQQPRKWGIKRQPENFWPILATVAALTVASIGGLYLYHSAGRAEASRVVDAAMFVCPVSRVIDGDTLVCSGGKRVRLHAVAARERDGSCTAGHPCPNASAEAATSKLRELVQGGALRCKSTGTSYDRVTAICQNAAGLEINCAMVISGTALRWPRFEATEPLCSGRYGANS